MIMCAFHSNITTILSIAVMLHSWAVHMFMSSVTELWLKYQK